VPERSDYWAVDLPELTKDDAEDVLQFVAERHDIKGSRVDPDLFLTLHLDRETAEALSRALKGENDDQIAQSLLGIVNEWLESTIDPSPGDPEPASAAHMPQEEE
jgi:hypothetical protein